MKYVTKIIEGKMMACSSDIRVGEKFLDKDTLEEHTCIGIKGNMIQWDEDCFIAKFLCIQPVAATDETADWIKEDMEFDEDDVEGFMWAGNTDQLGFLVFKMK